MNLKFQPFRRATLKDPYYKRLATAKDKRNFWKIFSQCPMSPEFRDIFERMTAHDPALRPSLEELQTAHAYLRREPDYHLRREQNIRVESEARNACKNVQELLTDADLN
jgi:hypothetical protein